MGYKHSILIATVPERKIMFEALVNEFNRLIKINGYEKDVEIISDDTPRLQMSIGEKSQLMLDRASGLYVNRFDDDDWPYPNYLTEIMCGIEKGVDCIGMLIHMTINGSRPQTCCHSLKYKDIGWRSHYDGYDYVRNVTHFNPVKRSLAQIVGFKNMRHGEDREYSDVLTHLCKTEHFIPRKIFHYRYTNYEPHNKKYGITP